MFKTIEKDPAELRPNPWNTNHVPPDAEDKLVASVQRLGMFKPVICRELADGALEILGGEHRVLAARKMGVKVPIVNLGRIDDERAKEISIVDNSRYGSDDALELAELLNSLSSKDELKDFLPHSDAELEAIFASVSIDLDELDLDENNDEEPVKTSEKSPRTHQIMRFKVAIEDAERISDLIKTIQKRHGFTEADELTNAGDALMQLLFDGGADA